MVPSAFFLIALLVAGGFAIVEVRSEPPGAGYFLVSTKEGYPISRFVQGMEVKVKVVPRGCYELDRIEVQSGKNMRTFADVDEVLITIEDYMTEVTAIFKGYPEDKCPYFTVAFGDKAFKVEKSLAYLLLIPPIGAAAVLMVKGFRLRREQFPKELTNLRFLEGKLGGREFLDLIVFLNACRSAIEGDPVLMRMKAPRRPAGPTARYEELLLASVPVTYEVVGLGRLVKSYPWVLDYAFSRGLVPSSRKAAMDAVRKVLRLIRAGSYSEIPKVVVG